MWYAVVLYAFILAIANALDCNLDDIQNTTGRCVPFRQCVFAIENYKAGIKPKICSGSVVCCPTEATVAQKKCDEWRSYLQEPIHFSQEPLEPFCVESAGFTGISGDRRDASKYEYSHAAALGFHTSNGIRYYCGGTIISEEWILTAAQCIVSAKGKPSVVLVGDIALDRQISYFRNVVPISEWVVHPGYKPPLGYNDIALVKLSEPLDISRYLLPACLAIAGNNLKETGTLEAIGWGTTGFREPQSNNLLPVNLTIFGKQKCNNWFAETTDKPFRFPEGIIRTQLCAGEKSMSGKDTCNGDGGGSLTVNEVYNSKELRCMFHVMGLTSFGPRVCGQNVVAVYTRLQSFVPWIESVVFENKTVFS